MSRRNSWTLMATRVAVWIMLPAIDSFCSLVGGDGDVRFLQAGAQSRQEGLYHDSLIMTGRPILASRST
jgi:hypothetical protein